MDQAIACQSQHGTVTLRAESIPFSELPGQSRLFLEYQNEPSQLRRYYPDAVNSLSELTQRIPLVLENHKADRGILCEALAETNAKFGAGTKTFENIELLRLPETVAVVTGQQAGLFTGPLYTIYKALSAIKQAECLRQQGFSAVPVFWVATEDHDFEEVSQTYVIRAARRSGREQDRTQALSRKPTGRLYQAGRYDHLEYRNVGRIPIAD